MNVTKNRSWPTWEWTVVTAVAEQNIILFKTVSPIINYRESIIDKATAKCCCENYIPLIKQRKKGKCGNPLNTKRATNTNINWQWGRIDILLVLYNSDLNKSKTIIKMYYGTSSKVTTRKEKVFFLFFFLVNENYGLHMLLGLF